LARNSKGEGGGKRRTEVKSKGDLHFKASPVHVPSIESGEGRIRKNADWGHYTLENRWTQAHLKRRKPRAEVETRRRGWTQKLIVGRKLAKGIGF